jgi:hypothetical protein
LCDAAANHPFVVRCYTLFIIFHHGIDQHKEKLIFVRSLLLLCLMYPQHWMGGFFPGTTKVLYIFFAYTEKTLYHVGFAAIRFSMFLVYLSVFFVCLVLCCFSFCKQGKCRLLLPLLAAVAGC